MSNIAIEFENISKQYRLGTIGTGTLSHDLNRWWYQIRGKEDPYLKIGEVNDRSLKASSDYVWALKDISFKVEQGEVLGIIGKNGAGKSTLLKILSRITSPSTGIIKAKGRIASLLEVGTGFHQDLTGRENIYMNGAIMGMTRHEISSKLDEIVAFSGIEKYIDTPVKRYSSGMTVRLGFAVAAHLEPEILVVDEVLAVGDAEFQKKAIGKMKDVSQGGGRTVLFVSHNLDTMKKLCNRGILLKNGQVETQGNINEVLNHYVADGKNTDIVEFNKQILNDFTLKSAFLSKTKDSVPANDFLIGESWSVNLDFEISVGAIDNIIFGIGLCSALGTPINTTWAEAQSYSKGKYQVKFINNDLYLQRGTYKIIIGISQGNKSLFYNETSLQFDVSLLSEERNDNLIKVDGTTGFLTNQLTVLLEKK